MDYMEINWKDKSFKLDANDVMEIILRPGSIEVTRYIRNTAGHFYREADNDGHLLSIAHHVEVYPW